MGGGEKNLGKKFGPSSPGDAHQEQGMRSHQPPWRAWLWGHSRGDTKGQPEGWECPGGLEMSWRVTRGTKISCLISKDAQWGFFPSQSAGIMDYMDFDSPANSQCSHPCFPSRETEAREEQGHSCSMSQLDTHHPSVACPGVPRFSRLRDAQRILGRRDRGIC